MKKNLVISFLVGVSLVCSFAFDRNESPAFMEQYFSSLARVQSSYALLLQSLQGKDPVADKGELLAKIQQVRQELKPMDFWWRYLEPNQYRLLNGPLPVEWETEVFEKFEQPYRREGAGLTLAAIYLDEEDAGTDSLRRLLQKSITALQTFSADSITQQLAQFSTFYLCNRLYLLNLAAIYTTGFECPDTTQVVPELRTLLKGVQHIYGQYNAAFPQKALPPAYLKLYDSGIAFADAQPAQFSAFDRFQFIRDFVNPLFALNQELIREYRVVSRSLVDYSLSKKAVSIFSKDLYRAQDAKGIYRHLEDTALLETVAGLGRLLFYDPLLSGNNERSCASCHKPTEFFTDTGVSTAFEFNHTGTLPRNTPSLLNAGLNQLLMLDGRHYNLQQQAAAVLVHEKEMNCASENLLQKVLSCDTYKQTLKKLLPYTPTEKEIGLEHLTSALSYYYTQFSRYDAPFDRAMNGRQQLPVKVIEGFNLFMGKAQCGTCHFVPQFNGVKPPYTGSEFEVLGVPADKDFQHLSKDVGRYGVWPVAEMKQAFRTGTVRNVMHTAPICTTGCFPRWKK
jgi:cytochrome c peroxidase